MSKHAVLLLYHTTQSNALYTKNVNSLPPYLNCSYLTALHTLYIYCLGNLADNI